eukprot:gene7738-15827_t
MEKYEDIIKSTATDGVDADEWLEAINLTQYASVLRANFACDDIGNRISVKRLKTLRLKDFPQMNITDLNHQRQIMDHINATSVKKEEFVDTSMEEVKSYVRRSSMRRNSDINFGDKIPSRSLPSSLETLPILSMGNYFSNDSSSEPMKIIGTVLDEKPVTRRKSIVSRQSFDSKAWNSINKFRQETPLNALDKLRCGNLEPKNESSISGESIKAHHRTSEEETHSKLPKNNQKHTQQTNLEKGHIYGNRAAEFDAVQRGMSTLQKDYLNGLKEVVRCEVANILFVNDRTRELSLYVNERWFRVPMASSIAGACATSGTVLNIPDANVDKMTGFKTRNILCQPIRTKHGSGPIIGVLQMLNKTDMTDFDEQDEDVLAICVQRIADDLASRFRELLKAAESFNGIGELVTNGVSSSCSNKIRKYDASTVTSFERKRTAIADELDRSIAEKTAAAAAAASPHNAATSSNNMNNRRVFSGSENSNNINYNSASSTSYSGYNILTTEMLHKANLPPVRTYNSSNSGSSNGSVLKRSSFSESAVEPIRRRSLVTDTMPLAPVQHRRSSRSDTTTNTSSTSALMMETATATANVQRDKDKRRTSRADSFSLTDDCNTSNSNSNNSNNDSRRTEYDEAGGVGVGVGGSSER